LRAARVASRASIHEGARKGIFPADRFWGAKGRSALHPPVLDAKPTFAEMEEKPAETERLRRDVEGALRRALDPSDVIPLLHRLARTAAPGTDESVFAHRHLAELIAARHPWRAALYARRVTAERPDDDRAWAVLALCQTLLANYRFAAASYQRALSCAPKNPWYAHNLGHLLDVALGRPQEALGWLRTAYAGAPTHGEIATSLAHALARAGQLAEAKRVLGRAMRKGASSEQQALLRWIEQGAPADKRAARSKPTIVPLPGTEDVGVPSRVRPAKRVRPAAKDLVRQQVTALHAALDRGLENLPLAPRQRARARALARDVVSREVFARGGAGEDGALRTQAVAAAIAYAIVWLDEVPLTQAEVAAPFRVSVARLRGRFAELRSKLALHT
jgi:Tetratricopeptide repeat